MFWNWEHNVLKTELEVFFGFVLSSVSQRDIIRIKLKAAAALCLLATILRIC